jgi:ATP-dependent Clp protease ATP-binding subunit ClpC
VFERFTDEARQVVVHAQDEARSLGHDSIGSAHLLLGVLRLPGDGVAPGVLHEVGVTLLDAREALVRLEGRGGHAGSSGQIPFAADAQRALEGSLDEVRRVGRGIGAEHLLLALARDEGQAARLLLDFDVDPQRIRSELLAKLRDAPPPEAPDDAAEPPEPPARRRASFAVLPLLAGWFAFGAAVGLGLLLGWLIWG